MKNNNHPRRNFFVYLLFRVITNRMTPNDYAELRSIYLKLPISPSGKLLAKRLFLGVCNLGRLLAKRRVESHFSRTFTHPCLAASVQQQDKADYFVFGIIDWRHLQQRPQHLSKELTKLGHRVFFISPQLKHADHKGFEAEGLDDEGRLFSVRIQAYLPCNIHYKIPDSATVAELSHSFGELLCWSKSEKRIFLVEHPTWYPLVSRLSGGVTVYDCMDYHEGFGEGENRALRDLENSLITFSELIIVTSQWLEDAVKTTARKTTIIRNAGEYAHFCTPPANVYSDLEGRRTLGYYGMIAEWFDIELLKSLAAKYPDCRILLIGRDTICAQSKLKKYSNIVFLGEIPYGDLPAYLYSFDVCLLPFLPTPLIQATNPVKVYEYLCAGKPVVSVDIPEMNQFAGLVYTAKDNDEFIEQVRTALLHADAVELAEKRRLFAQNQTWQERAKRLTYAVNNLFCQKKLSIVIITYNNLHLTKSCLESIDSNTHNRNREIFVVDNGSSDGTPGYLHCWQEGHAERHCILNSDNKGFAAANNQGLRLCSGDYLVMLNNDTYVTPGWDLTLMHHLERNPTLGMICPVTNNIGNEAKIDVTYKNVLEMLEASRQYTCRHMGELYPLRTVAFFCAMMPRSVYEAVGPVCEEYGRGWFEDDDYCRRVEGLGYTMACAEDAFVHHELSASFNTLPSPERVRLFEGNKAIYEAKWGTWIPHQARPAL